MTTPYPVLTESEKKAIVNLCVRAGLADGLLSDQERESIQRVASGFLATDPAPSLGAPALGGPSLAAVAQDLQSANSRALAYEMAVCICAADSGLQEGERRFLEDVRAALNIESGAAGSFQRQAEQIQPAPPVISSSAPAAAAGLDDLIRDRAILTGALELMPHRLATMAIIPLQMRLVYQVGKAFGYDLDLAHTREFFAAAGVGLTSQVVEGYLSKAVGHLARPLLGRFIAGLAAQATESAVAFATTFALGQAAKSYYQSGRQLSTAQLREVFASMLNQGRAMQGRYSSEIASRAGSMNLNTLASLARA